MRVPLVLGLLLAVGGVAVAAWLAFSGPGDGLPATPPEWTDEGGAVATAKTPGHEVVAGTLEDEFGDPVEGAHVYLLERGDPIIPAFASGSATTRARAASGGAPRSSPTCPPGRPWSPSPPTITFP